ncbi:MAG: glycosyl hydrolase [Planctomycetota bacterium]|nr:glycosyl hydrolase [Planctomycetota bacterium]
MKRNSVRNLRLETLATRELFSVTNFALYQSVVADSFINGNAPHEAVDGMVSNDSRWASDASGSSWLEVTLSAPYTVGSAHLYFGFDNTATVGAFSIQHFSGDTWVTVANIAGNTATEVKVQFASPVTGSTRFRFSTNQSSVRVKEFVLLPPGDHPLGTSVNLNLASVSAPQVSSIYQTNYGIHATDGWVSDNSRWLADGAGPHSMEVRLLSPHLVGSFHLYSGASSGTTFQLAAFTLEYAKQTAPGAALDWLPVTGGIVSSGTMTGNSVSGNTSGAMSIQLTTPVIATNFRVSFTQAFGRIREFLVLPATNASTGTVGYPIGTSVNIAPKPATMFAEYGDRYYRINSRVNNNSLVSSDTTTSQVAGSTTGESIQYQLLYSYAWDAYRIVNKDSNKALEVLRASGLAGATVAEGNYSASPHQLWRLIATDGGFFQIVNVWSGMALDLDVSGTSPVVTQQLRDTNTNPANRQEWQPVFVENNFKKGLGGNLGQFASDARWGYDWSAVPDPDNGDKNFFFTPMQWWAREDGVDALRDYYGDWHNNVTPSFLLGFNEPDHLDQANATVERAVEAWPQLVKMDLPLLSPANATGGEPTWLTPFMDQVDALGYRVDYTGMHWYAAPNVNTLMSRIDAIQTMGNGRPVWLTEFSIVDWNGGSGNWSEEQTYNFIIEFLWRAETKANLEKYALFMWTEDAVNGPTPTNPWTMSNPRSNTFYLDRSLTPYGKAYVSWDGQTTIENDTPYILHNRSASHRVANSGGSGLNASTIRVEDATVQFQLRDAGNGRRHIVSGADGRLLRFNGTTLDFAPRGTTGTAVEWTISQEQFGWQNIIHPQTGRHLQLNRTNNASNAPTALSFTMVTAASATTTASDWFFVKPFDAIFDVGPVADSSTAANQVNENSPVGTLVGITAIAAEPDPGQTVTYTLTDNAGGRFAIHSTTGIVTVAGPIDFETATSHSITIRASSSDGTTSNASFVINVLNVQEFSAITNRKVFYNNAAGFGTNNLNNSPLINPINAIDPSKSALLPGGTTTLANFTNYSRGLNGIVIDLTGATNLSSISASSFQFATWSNFTLTTPDFVSITPTVTVSTFAGGGTGGADRVKLVFADNAIQNAWLRITVLADANTSLATNDVFYFGNARFDVTPATSFPSQVGINILDTNIVRGRNGTDSNNVSNIFDVDKSGSVNILDTNATRGGNGVNSLRPFTAPLPPANLLLARRSDAAFVDMSWLEPFDSSKSRRRAALPTV